MTHGNQNVVRLWETLRSNYSMTHRPISEHFWDFWHFTCLHKSSTIYANEIPNITQNRINFKETA